MNSTFKPSGRLLRALFASLAEGSPHHRRRWTLTRHLRSDNPAEINGELRGIATFQPLPATSNTSMGVSRGGFNDLLYREEGEMPGNVMGVVGRGMAGLRWTKKYIWRLNDGNNNIDEGDSTSTPDRNVEMEKDGRTGISVWFVKVAHDEADYLFHEFEFDDDDGDAGTRPHSQSQSDNEETDAENIFVTAPTPPDALVSTPSASTIVLTARGNHLCIKDMYRTAYAFRIRPDTGEVLSWASRHVVKGPKKNQDIVNLYERED
jgi:hypothetical protein